LAAKERERQVREQRTAVLLDKAQRALEADRLIAPESDNAVMYSGEILGLDANHAEAKRILEAVVSRLTTLGETAVQQGDLPNAKSHHQAAEGIARQFKISETGVRRIAELIAAQEQRLAEEAETKRLTEEQQRRAEAERLAEEQRRKEEQKRPAEPPQKLPQTDLTAQMKELEERQKELAWREEELRKQKEAVPSSAPQKQETPRAFVLPAF
jgi:translation initiation factor 3 subunit A